jgi:multiple sugar transport system substrate-binding protein
MMASRQKTIRALLVGGPMYDPLYDAIPSFERESGYAVEVVDRLPHPELNAYVRRAFNGAGADIDLLSTHTKYAPSQAEWLAPLDELVDGDTLADLLPRPLELARIDGQLLQMPRNLDVRLLHYRKDLFEDREEQKAFESVCHRPLTVPETWSELAEVASFFTRPGSNGSAMYGFLFPGRDSGLFGTFYELLTGCGGTLFDDALRPAFDSTAGVWAAGFLNDLHQKRQVTPRELPSWHYDEISIAFRHGSAAMVCDWPGSYHLYRNPATCHVSDRVGQALLPAGPAGVRAAYAGCHSFAIPRTAPNAGGGAALLRFLTSFDAQLGEARLGAIPCRRSALQRVQEEASADTSHRKRWQLLSETERTMIIPPRFAAYPQCEDAIWQAVQQAMLDQMSPADAVTHAAAETQLIVDARLPGTASRRVGAL